MSLAFPKSEFMLWSFDDQIASEIQANENQANQTIKSIVSIVSFVNGNPSQSYTNETHMK